MKKILLALSAFVVMAFGGDYEDGLAAYNNKDYKKAMELWTELADRGYSQAQYNLGLMYSDGQGVKQDYKKAVELYQKAADQGYAPAQV